MHSHNPTEIGQKGEELACEYLLQQGYNILEKNWRYKHLEIDIIAEKDIWIVVIEVKYRSYTTYGEPEVFVTRQKQKFLIEAINQYIHQKGIDKEVRFDIIAISKKKEGFSIHHLPDAFYAR